jgi:hypothetical protein
MLRIPIRITEKFHHKGTEDTEDKESTDYADYTDFVRRVKYAGELDRWLVSGRGFSRRTVQLGLKEICVICVICGSLIFVFFVPLG